MSRRQSFIADRRGAVAFEMPFIYLFVFLVLILPLADAAMLCFKYISAWQALSSFGQYLQYNPPADVINDVTNKSSPWMVKVHNRAQSLGVSDPTIFCGDSTTGCSNASLSPKYYSYTTSVTLRPMGPLALRSIFCPNGVSVCNYTLRYQERFQ
jgi:hypothetical protein